MISRGKFAAKLANRLGDSWVDLDLPEPPAQSGEKGWRQQWRKVYRYKSAAWIAAVRQVRPFAEPPERVRIHALFRLHSPRDAVNLPGDLKPVLDALKQVHPSTDRLRWRNGVCEMRGYFVDDRDGQAELGIVEQTIDRSDRGLTLVIERLDP